MERSISSSTAVGFATDFEPPAAEEVEELLDPTLEEQIEAVTDAASSVSATLMQSDTDQTETGKGIDSAGTRSAGPEDGPGNQNVIGRWDRWEIRFNVRGQNDYASQLDFFGIELAAFGGGQDNIIESATNVSSRPMRKVNDDPASETRLYFSWKRYNPLVQFDQQLLNAAGITTTGRNVIRFTPPALEKELLLLEKNFCERNGKAFPRDIAKTVFESRPKTNGFEFKIIRQRYRVGR